MADPADDECTSTKRARLSSDCHPEQKDSSTRYLDIDEPRELAISLDTKNEEGVFLQTSPGSREHHGGFANHERLESGDFPTCFSVEDDIDDTEEHRYQPIAGPMGWVQRQMILGINPEDILSYMVPHVQLPCSLDKTTLWKIIIDILTEPSPRQKLDHINTLDDVLELLKGSKNIIVLTGAGVSVSCGIPDFRSRDGIYARLSVEYPDLPDPQAMFDISYFYQNPRPFFKFAKEIYPGQFKPSLSHRFIRQLESNDQLLRNYSQNIDTLEQVAGITRVIQCHGSFSTASCTNCKYQVSSDAIKEDIFNQVIPRCRKCTQDGGLAIMKPDIVFFGEGLPSEFYHQLDEDSEKVDLLIVIGSSLKVRPVALIPSHLPPEVPQILINREPLRQMTFDVELLGDCDVIVAELCQRLGGTWRDLLEEFEVPCVEGKSSCAEEPTLGAGISDPKESNRPQNEQTPHTEAKDAETVDCTPSNPQPSTDEGACETDAPRPLDSHVTAGETSSIKETEDGSCHDQPRTCASFQDTAYSSEPPRFHFLPPSRYIFSGAEVMDSPLPSPARGKLPYLDSSGNTSDSDSDSVGEIDDDKPLCDEICEELVRHSSEGSFCSNSDDGFGEGESEDKTRQALSLILGELSAYTCESEGNSRMSASDDLPPPAPVPSHGIPSAPEATTASLVTRPFSAVDLGVVLPKGGESEPSRPSGHHQDDHASVTSKEKHVKFADDTPTSFPGLFSTEERAKKSPGNEVDDTLRASDK